MADQTLPGLLRRIRRFVDMSQRELARASGVAPAAIGRAEAGGDLRVSQLSLIGAVAGLRVALLDDEGRELVAMTGAAVRDAGGRLFPAHLDTRHGDEDWWGGPHRPRLRNPRYTFDRDRSLRDWRRQASPSADHHVPEAGDSLAERAATRRAGALRRDAARRQVRHEARLAAGSPLRPDWEVDCTCPAGCEYDEQENRDRLHAPDCACGCDVD
ncbi:helix-turn-helix domain-containing protein [Modestobacter altitudinis]|uniref:helix-turn-helix domain-containing protein n=1 Tax=Modestobacter altitudinis TaxID=2213158 RepID=UPI00110CA8DD|nr:helix-turn-helix transcriptional regulator [Modestobacter altitudinis]